MFQRRPESDPRNVKYELYPDILNVRRRGSSRRRKLFADKRPERWREVRRRGRI